MPRLICVSAGCDDLAIDGLSHCELHDQTRREKVAEKRRAAQLSPEAMASRAMYNLPGWRAESKAWLRRYPLCVDCADLGGIEPAQCVDHKEPHKGDPVKFWDRRNWQGLCFSCHNRKTAHEVFHGRKSKGG